tara:strand:+ start:4683 stop:5231 length:549 start_codon:yes stop_codon:yes gene_type:complete
MDLDGDNIEVIDNFLSTEDFKKVSGIMNHDMFPWFFNEAVATLKDTDNFYFTHFFYRNSKVDSPHFNDALMPLLQKLPHGNLYRAKANLFVRQNKKVINGKHVDLSDAPPNFQTAVYYVNSNNGGTLIGDKLIQSKANRILIMKKNIEHSSVGPTDEKKRIVININYILNNLVSPTGTTILK